MLPPLAHGVAAAIDIGSNSVHVVASRSYGEFEAGKPLVLEQLVGESDLIGLGDAVDAGGSIPDDTLSLVVGAVERQVLRAREVGASDVVLLGTEPMRRAANAGQLVAAVRAATGLEVHILTVRQEAQLTFAGVTGGSAPNEELAVIDIGGGSTEAVIHLPGAALEIVAMPFGSARLTNATVRHDPPTADEQAQLMSSARRLVDEVDWPQGTARVRRTVFVGGTATNVARLGPLDAHDLKVSMATLGELTAEQVTERFVVRPRRARQLAAGVAIVSALLERFSMSRAEVSEASLRDGAIIAMLARGERWLSDLDELVR